VNNKDTKQTSSFHKEPVGQSNLSPKTDTKETGSLDENNQTQGKGIPEHPHHSQAGAPGPTGTAPGEAIEPSSRQHQDHHQYNSSPKAHTEESNTSLKDTDQQKDSSSTDQKTKATDSSDHEGQTQGKGIPEHPHHSQAGAPGPTGTAPGEAIEPSSPQHQDHHHNSPPKAHTEESNTSLKENKQQKESSSTNKAMKATDSSDHEGQAQGKGIPEHPHHSEAGAPGPTGTAPGEAIEPSSPQHQDHHHNSSPKAHPKAHTEESNTCLKENEQQKNSSSTNKEKKATDSSDHEGQTQGKGIPEHPHQSEAGAPGPTGTAPGEPIEEHHKEASSDTQKTQTGPLPEKDHSSQEPTSTNNVQKDEQTQKSAKHTTHTSGKGIPEQKHHFDAGAPGPTGTAPGEAMQAAQQNGIGHSSHKSHNGKPVLEDEDKNSASTKEDVSTAQEKSTHLAPHTKHEKHDSHHEISSSEEKHSEHHHTGHKEHHERAKFGKGIPELKHHFNAGAPGATGTAPGEPMN
jgi:hypothetical protein